MTLTLTLAESIPFMLTNRDQNFIAFCDELRAYVEVHHHFPNKHTAALNRIKYIRKKINEGTLEERKRVMFMEIAEMRDMEEHTGGRKRVKGWFKSLSASLVKGSSGLRGSREFKWFKGTNTINTIKQQIDSFGCNI